MVQLEVCLGDITNLAVDVIVNAANTSLLGGGGVDGAIHRIAGPQLLEVCREIGGCPTGEVRITPGFRLAARYVIHAVGPVWRGGDQGERQNLHACYVAALRLANKHGCRSIAFPCISTGVYHFPKEEAARIAVEAVKTQTQGDTTLERIVFVCFDEVNFRIYETLLKV
jgi:O-acetyl-ADP-ribose deacetylase (regulator of RNase III)